MAPATLFAASNMAVALAVSAAGSSLPDRELESELRRMTQELLDAVAPGRLFVDRREGEDVRW